MSHSNYPYAVFAAHTHHRQRAAILASVEQLQNNSAPLDTPSIILQAVIIPGEKTAEGQLVESVASVWFDIIKLMLHSPEEIYKIDWRKWEEIIAGAYSQQGFDVVLTPRSNDKGRDIIATATSSFAPGVFNDQELARFIPYRLELKWREPLLEWLAKIAAKES
jgi:hypothetical protein